MLTYHKYSQTVGYSITDIVPLHQWRHLAWQAGIIACSLQHQLRPPVFFLPQATHIVTFTTTKTNQQRGSILLGLRLLSVCPSSKVASAISLSPWGYSCQSSTMLRTCVVLETFRTWLTNSLQGDITNLALPFLYQNPRILDLTLPTKAQYVLVVVNLTLKLAYELVNCSRNLFYISLVLVNPLTLTISFSPTLFKAQYFR